MLKRHALVLAAALAGCDSTPILTAPGASAALPAGCDTVYSPPVELRCTGLYADIVNKTVAPGVEEYAPAIALWSDGASKRRWIYLPPGTVIDNTVPDEWVFPVGTKVWKEFTRSGQRAETRMWQKDSANFWINATYAWSPDEMAAKLSSGGDVLWSDGSTYHIPTNDECQKCHRGRTDRILGFEQALLGLDGATGMTLDRLVTEGRLSVPPPVTQLAIGDDGTGAAAPALAWLHVNCGTTCHNRNSNSSAWSTNMFMRLDPTLLDGSPVNAFDALTTSVGVPAVSTNWSGQPRIVPGDPAGSLVYYLITHRGQGDQMPPIATSVVDADAVPLIEAWIRQMAP